jgi:hypothetical protein
MDAGKAVNINFQDRMMLYLLLAYEDANMTSSN